VPLSRRCRCCPGKCSYSAICLATGRLCRSSRLTERSGAPRRRGAGRSGRSSRPDYRLAISLAVRGRERCHSRVSAIQHRSDLDRLQPRDDRKLRETCQVASAQVMFPRSQHALDLGNVELRGVEPLTSCMPCNKSNAPAWASTAPTWTYSARACLRVPANLCAMAVYLAVRWSLITSCRYILASVAQQSQDTNDPDVRPGRRPRPDAHRHRPHLTAGQQPQPSPSGHACYACDLSVISASLDKAVLLVMMGRLQCVLLACA